MLSREVIHYRCSSPICWCCPPGIELWIHLLLAVWPWECCFLCLILSLWVRRMETMNHPSYGCLWCSDEVTRHVRCPAHRVIVNPMKLNTAGRVRAQMVCRSQGPGLEVARWDLTENHRALVEGRLDLSGQTGVSGKSLPGCTTDRRWNEVGQLCLLNHTGLLCNLSLWLRAVSLWRCAPVWCH